jgi:hypothetical protein
MKDFLLSEENANFIHLLNYTFVKNRSRKNETRKIEPTHPTGPATLQDQALEPDTEVDGGVTSEVHAVAVQNGVWTPAVPLPLDLYQRHTPVRNSKNN